jgi:hypothetical protein
MMTPVHITRLDRTQRQQLLRRILSSLYHASPEAARAICALVPQSMSAFPSPVLGSLHRSCLHRSCLHRSCFTDLRVPRGSLSSTCWIAMSIALALVLNSLTPLQPRIKCRPADAPAPRCRSNQTQPCPSPGGLGLGQLFHLPLSVVQGSRCGHELMNDWRRRARQVG